MPNDDEVDLTAVAYLIQEERDADRARRWHEAEAAKYARIRDQARDQLEARMGNRNTGLVNGHPVITKTRSKQFAHARFREAHPQIYQDYLVARFTHELDMDRLRAELPLLVEAFSSLRWTNNSEVLGEH